MKNLKEGILAVIFGAIIVALNGQPNYTDTDLIVGFVTVLFGVTIIIKFLIDKGIIK